jgi:hypothetical protein
MFPSQIPIRHRARDGAGAAFSSGLKLVELIPYSVVIDETLKAGIAKVR